MSFRLVDHPDDRPEFLREVIEILSRSLDAGRARMVEHVARASDAELVAGDENEWSVGMIAYHAFVSERGMVGIALRLARGETPASTAQPRPAVGTTTREVLLEAAAKAARAVERLRTDFTSEPDFTATAPSPYFGPFNCVSWLLACGFHYHAHLEALERGTKSAF